ncbi:predicted protein, partial [Nematostella vectensis]
IKSLIPRDPKIRQVGDPVLREPAEAVDVTFVHSPDFKAMVDRLVKVMRSHDGAGIAAPQIGVGLQVIAMEYTGKHMKKLKDNGFSDKDLKRMGIAIVPLKVFINPKLRVINPKMLAFRESCLSVEGHSAVVPRMSEVEVTALDQNATPITWRAAGWPARILQHEVDHLKGNLYVDSMLYKTFMNNNWQKYAK